MLPSYLRSCQLHGKNKIKAVTTVTDRKNMTRLWSQETLGPRIARVVATSDFMDTYQDLGRISTDTALVAPDTGLQRPCVE